MASGRGLGTSTVIGLALVALLVALSCASAPARPERTERPLARTPSPARAASDLVYLVTARGRGLAVVAMPEGRATGEFPAPRLLSFVDEEVAIVPANAREDTTGAPLRAELERWRTHLDRIDLRTGQRVLRIDAGTVELATSDPRFGPLLAAPVALAGAEKEAARPGGALPPGRPSVETVLLLRRDDAGGPMARFDRFDARTGAPLLSRTAPLDAVLGSSSLTLSVSLSLRAIDSERALLVRRTSFAGRRRVDWSLLDADLSTVATVTKASSAGSPADSASLAWTPWCATDVRPLPALGAWATLCEDDGDERGLLLVEARTLREAAAIALPGAKQLGRAIAWRSGADGATTVLTDRPALIRADLAARRVLDARAVTASPTLPFARFPVTAPDVQGLGQVAPDGRLAYVTQTDAQARRFLAAINVETAKVVGTQLSGLDVRAIRVAPDGTRLYALASEGSPGVEGPTRLYLLDARTLALVTRSDVLDPAPIAIAAVVAR